MLRETLLLREVFYIPFPKHFEWRSIFKKIMESYFLKCNLTSCMYLAAVSGKFREQNIRSETHNDKTKAVVA